MRMSMRPSMLMKIHMRTTAPIPTKMSRPAPMRMNMSTDTDTDMRTGMAMLME